MYLCVRNGRDGDLCPSSGCVCQGVITSNYQVGPVASRIRGLGARYRGGCKSESDTGEMNVTRHLLEGPGGPGQLQVKLWGLGLTKTSLHVHLCV